MSTEWYVGHWFVLVFLTVQSRLVPSIAPVKLTMLFGYSLQVAHHVI